MNSTLPPELRIASLLPSATEIICALGGRDNLVGVSHECDYPAGVGELPKLTSPRYRIPDSSAGIDGAVRSVLESALSIYNVDTELLRGLKPDIVFTQDLCRVCAPSLDDVQQAVRQWCGPDTVLVSQSPQDLQQVLQDFEDAGCALGSEQAGERLKQQTARSMLALQMNWVRSGRPAVPVLTVEWIEPLMAGGLWMAELIKMAGGEPLLTERGQHSKPLTDEELADIAPEVVLVHPCGFDLTRGLREADILMKRLPAHWPAVANKQVWFSDGSHFFNRPGPRLYESMWLLNLVLHPELHDDQRAMFSKSLMKLGGLPW
ncbi:MAG: ABC transporter substrate-binding protein [Planctomycetales bacterium]|nr:ABC transporter substrate-binding protein [bacterium]UNM06980.1 MAG: ABC transporter substrate-binding protein [Planctomycetales bacterium]